MKKILATISGIWLATLCWGGPDRHHLEGRLVETLVKTTDLYRAMHNGNTPTNWTQLRPLISVEYLAFLEREFKRLGKKAGFQTSIVEKYVFLPPGVKMQGYPRSRVLMLGTSPFRVRSGEAGRYVIFDPDDEDQGFEDTLRCRWLREEKVQQMLAESRVKMPTPNPDEAREARETVDKALAEQRAMERVMWESARQNAPQPTWEERWSVGRERFKALFIKQPLYGTRAGSPDQPPHGEIRPVPVTLGILFLFGSGFLIYRWFAKGKKPRIQPTQENLGDSK